MVIIASGIARGRVCTTAAATTTTVESRKMASIPNNRLTERHAALVYCLLLWYWTSMLWSTDTCQNKVSVDQYHVAISRAQLDSSSRSSVFLKVSADHVLVFRLDRGLMSGQLVENRAGLFGKPVNADPESNGNQILLYKHQWNTKWAFPRKLHIFTREDNVLSSHVKRSPSLWLHNKSRLWKRRLCLCLSLVFI